MKLLKIALLVPLLGLVACGEKTEEEVLAEEKAKVEEVKKQYANDYIGNLGKLLDKRTKKVQELTKQAAKTENPAARQAIETKIASEKKFIAKLNAQIATRKAANK